MESKEIKVKFVNGSFVPLGRVNFKDGEVIEIEVVSREKDARDDLLEKEFTAWDRLSDEALENLEKEL
ncbi:MAG: antitoxin AF2212-like protein [Nanoarchaeota archaeon]